MHKPINQRSILIALLLLCSINVFGGTKKKILELKNRTLVVILIDRSASRMGIEIKGYRDSAKAENINIDSAVVKFNEHFESAMRKCWTFSSRCIFVPYDSIKYIHAEKNEKFAFLSLNYLLEGQRDAYYYFSRVDIWDAKFCRKIFPKFCLYEDDKEPIYIQDMPALLPSEAILTYGIEQMQNSFKEYEPGNKTEHHDKHEVNLLSQKTLLIVQDDLDSSLDAESIKTYYPYPFKISDMNEICEKIMSRDEHFAYLIIIPMIEWKTSMSGNSIDNWRNPVRRTNISQIDYGSYAAIYYNHYIVDSQSSDILAYSEKNTMSRVEYQTPPKIGKKNFKDYLKSQ